jgi:hypothetical protein
MNTLKGKKSCSGKGLGSIGYRQVIETLGTSKIVLLTGEGRILSRP